MTRLQEQVKTLFTSHKRLEERQEKHEEDDKTAFGEVAKQMQEINKNYSNRLPYWASLLIGVLMGAIGWLVK